MKPVGWYVAVSALVVLGAGCGGSDVEIATGAGEANVVAAPKVDSEPPIQYAFRTLQGEDVTTESMQGRMTVVVFGASYDMASQAQARFVTGVLKRHTPRINALLLVLEPEENRTLIEAFAQALRLPYPVAFAGNEIIEGRGPFPDMNQVPSVLILDRQGREVWRRNGISSEDDLIEALSETQSSEI